MIRAHSVATGRLIAVVGPSGVGKDSVMAGLKQVWPALYVVRRVVTRAPGLAGEAYDAVPQDVFDTMVSDGAFALHWRAHGLSYGLPVAAIDRIKSGTDCVANLSRAALTQAQQVAPRLVVLNLTATADTLAQRLAERGREDAPEIAARLARAERTLPAGLNVVHVSNDGPLDQTVADAAAALWADVPRRSPETETTAPSSEGKT